MNTISLEEARKILELRDEQGNHLPAALTAVTHDLARKTGGQRITFKNAVLVSMSHSTIKVKGEGNNEVRSIHPLLITHINGKEVTV